MLDFSSINGKVAIVTGASRGIGEAIARCYAEHGINVVCANRDPIRGNEVVESIKSKGGEAVFLSTDCSKSEDIKKLVDFAIEKYGRLDGIVNDAGIGMGGSPLHEYSLEDSEKIIDLNLKGVFAGMKYATEAILKSKSENGFIINIASIAGITPQRGQALYTATKFGVIGLTKSAALDYAPHNITVNAICPGYTDTSIFDGTPEQAKQYFINDCPSGRMGKAEECAYLALFLASDMARYINGAVIPIDGGLSAGAKNVIRWNNPEMIDM